MRCPVKGCKGRFDVCASKEQDRVRAGGRYVYLPNITQVRRRRCTVCGHVGRTIEISLEKYEKDFTFMNKLKVLLREYIGN